MILYLDMDGVTQIGVMHLQGAITLIIGRSI